MSEKVRIDRAVCAALAEQLEPRRLLAGIEAGILVARGTDGGDVISLRRTGPDDVIVTTNGVNQTFDMGDFTGVRLEGLNGSDRFRLIDPLVSPVVRNTTVLGGGGHDVVDYSARGEAIQFRGYEPAHAHPGMPFPFVSITSGAQEDRADNTVEHFIGGSADDEFNFDGGTIDDDRFSEPVLVLEGRGGSDDFWHVADLRASMYGGDGNDHFFADDERTQFNAIFAGDGDDVIGFNNFGDPSVLDAGAGVDTIALFGSALDIIDMRLYAGLENAQGVRPGLTVIGNALNNHISVNPFEEEADPVTLLGLGGDDTLVGGFGNDSLAGGFGDDSLDGGEGNDIADGGPGSNTYDNVELTPAAPRIRIDNRLLIAEGSWGSDLIELRRNGPSGVAVRVNETSAAFADTDFDRIELRGNNGFDEIRMLDEIPNVTLVGGGGNDTLLGSDGAETFLGGDAHDAVFAFGGDDSLVGAFGHDTLEAGAGRDTVDGGPGNDIIRDAEVTPPPPRIRLDRRTLIADGSWGVDLLTIEPVAGDDDVIVRVTDTVRRFDSDDFDGVLLRGQAGFDYLQVLQPIRGLKVTLEGGDGYDTLLGSDGGEVLRGGTGNDLLRGFGGNDALFGNGGADRLDAGGGNDFLEALDGQPFDTLLGGDGTDTAMIDAGDRFSGVEIFA